MSQESIPEIPDQQATNLTRIVKVEAITWFKQEKVACANRHGIHDLSFLKNCFTIRKHSHVYDRCL